MKHNLKTGFTLIEALISIAIMGILTAISYPSYIEFMHKARRSDAQTSLLALALAQERYYQQHSSYSNDISKLERFASRKILQQSTYYQMSITRKDENQDGFSGFILKATAIGTQRNDIRCLQLSIDHLNSQRAYDDKGNINKKCWH